MWFVFLTSSVNLPKPADLIGRLFVLAGHPHNGQGRGEHVLNLMKALAPNLKEELTELWDAVIPKLQSYLSGKKRTHLNITVIICILLHSLLCVEQDSKGTWDQRHWEDLMLKVGDLLVVVCEVLTLKRKQYLLLLLFSFFLEVWRMWMMKSG